MNDNALRVAVVSVHGCPLARLGERDTGGMNVYLLQLAKELGGRGIHVDVFTRYHDPADPQVVELGPNARVVHIKAGDWDEVKKNIYPLLPEFVDCLVRFQRSQNLSYDLIHSHYWLSGTAVSLLDQYFRLPHIASFHTLGEAKVRAVYGEKESEVRISSEKAILERADQVIALSYQDRKNMIEYYDAPPQRIQVIPGGIDMESFIPMDKDRARAELDITDPKILLYVGRVQPLKGPDLLLKAIACLEEDERQGLRLLIVGGDKEGDSALPHLQELARDLGISDMVSFLGIVDQKLLSKFYSAADVCIVPSHYESFGLVAAEALACGTPVVASRVGGLMETVKDGVNGYLVSWRCPEPFAERIELLLNNEYLRRSLGAQARASVERLSWPLIADQVETLYSSVAQVGN
ncbi:MAG: glycosyltransferase [Dehalococcoidia bacterium]